MLGRNILNIPLSRVCWHFKEQCLISYNKTSQHDQALGTLLRLSKKTAACVLIQSILFDLIRTHSGITKHYRGKIGNTWYFLFFFSTNSDRALISLIVCLDRTDNRNYSAIRCCGVTGIGNPWLRSIRASFKMGVTVQHGFTGERTPASSCSQLYIYYIAELKEGKFQFS